jgi:two-component system, NtrC family, sensor histidine kinase HydH
MNLRALPITRWIGAVLGLVMGSADTVLLRALGAQFELWVGAYFTVSFIALGFLIGLVVEARARERAAAIRAAEQARRLAEIELRVAHSNKLAALGQLAGTMAHELRNPLAIIRSTVQNLDETLEPGEAEARRTCRFVLEEIDRLTHVTASIVRFARPLVVRRRRLRSNELLERAHALADRMLSTRSVTLAPPATSSSAWLEGDADLLCQAVLGLVDNAAHFSPPGAPIELAVRSAGAEVVISVDDSGPGVSPDLRDKLFEPFFTTRDEGAGLGLSIVRQIAQAHGGRVLAADRPGGGARFEIHLPASLSEEIAA